MPCDADGAWRFQVVEPATLTAVSENSAQQIARTVPGVAGVRNEMELERQGNRGGSDGTGH
jgi:hypothetical protein